MPARKDISSVLVIGAGPIVIGQACEFDYSGTQACKVLKEEGLRVILVNSNPATIMTDPEIADATYVEPITVDVVGQIIEKEKPDALLSTVGGQTALNCGLELWKAGVLEQHNVKMIGADPEAIEKAENRQLFNEAMDRIGLAVPKNVTVSSLEEALTALDNIGLPAVIRPSFTLGGSGGGIAHTLEEFKKIVSYGLDLSPTHQVLIDESIVGWKEYEMEVIRDKNDNAIIICSIENIDPMGVHTGDSITVAPALTLTDKEYQVMRNASIAVLREIGVETGGSNVQFAVNPQDGRLVVIEMNPRVSRSSALASKATGFPIAKVAALLAIGYTLDEIKNDVTEVTPASFEPSIDYIVTKIPRFNFDKFNESDALLSSAMKSVGEVMSLGRNFSESLQKAFCSLESGFTGLSSPVIKEFETTSDLPERQEILRKLLAQPIPNRVLYTAEAFRYNFSVEEVTSLTGIDSWFLREIEKIVLTEQNLIKTGVPKTKAEMLKYKKLGFSDARLAELTHTSEDQIRSTRHKLEVRPVFKTVDTCAAEFASTTSYLYSCYEGNHLTEPACEAKVTNKDRVIILGSGPNRIGQGIEFDYTCVHAVKSLSEQGIEAIMVNCNPETVSTDYDTSDKLYFEPLCLEYVLEILHKEQESGRLLGVIVQLGGQTPLKLAQALTDIGIPILGTSPESIDKAEDREKFQKLLFDLKLKQPENTICYHAKELSQTIDSTVGYPVVVRPSHVLGGQAMAILHNTEELQSYLDIHGPRLVDGPILVDRFLEEAIEVDVDAICDGKEVYIAGIMEHIERAGVHSGDSACVLPPHSLSPVLQNTIRESTKALALSLEVVGLINVQYAVQGNELYVIEVNPRASRTTPFVAKATGVPIAKIAAQVMLGRHSLAESMHNIKPTSVNHYAVKESVLPFERFSKSDIVLNPEMKSTGEVMGWSVNLNEAFAKAQVSGKNPLPHKGTVFLCYNEKDHEVALSTYKKLKALKFNILTNDQATADYIQQQEGMDQAPLHLEAALKDSGLSLLEFIQAHKIQLAFLMNHHPSLKNLRRLLMTHRVSYFTTQEAALLALDSLKDHNKAFSVKPLQEIQSAHFNKEIHRQRSQTRP